MKKFFYMMYAVFFVSVIVSGQTLHIVETAGNTFSPSDLTINVQDTVRWVNSGGGFHNVVADDDSYTSGSASSSQWVYEYVFTTVGDSRYYCAIHGGKGGSGMSGIIHVLNATAIPERNGGITAFQLKQNYPNPFNPSTTIEFYLPTSEFTTLKVFNMLGREVKTLVSKNMNQGSYSYSFDGNNLSSGFYYYQLQAGNYSEIKRMILIK